jgi:UDP-N-acetylmuramoyl-tripeptide--D-alanyl-D-alanine ligase
MKNLFKKIIQFYLKILTKIIIWRKKPTVIAIAGTTNKTFVKEMILEELGRDPELVRGNPRSFNTEIGLPLAVLFLPSGYSSIFKWADILLTGTFLSLFSQNFPKMLVLEMGVDKKGDMEYLLSLIRPKIAVITSIDKSFPANGASLDVLAEEISLLVKSLPPDGLAVLNNDDFRVKKMGQLAACQVITYGQGKDAQFKIENIRTIFGGQSFDLRSDDNSVETIETERFGAHSLNSIAAAKIVARQIQKMNSNNDKNKKQEKI